MKNLIILLGLWVYAISAFGQGKQVPADKEGIPIITLEGIEIVAKAPSKRHLLKALERERARHRLLYNVRKVYPYVLIAKDLYAQIDREMNALDKKKDKKTYFKQREKELFTRWAEELKNMTVEQGRLLCLLMDRDLNKTTYAIIKELKGWHQALFWQTTAKFYNTDLKEKYDPNGEHKHIEEIIQREFGNLSKK